MIVIESYPLYVSKPVTRNQGLLSDTIFSSTPHMDDQSDQMLFLLNMETGIWKDFTSLYSQNSDLTPCPWGMWTAGKYDVTYLLNLQTNKMYRSRGEFTNKASKAFDKIEKNLWFFIDSTLYVGNVEQNTFDTLSISLNDFEYTGQPAYLPHKIILLASRRNFWRVTFIGLFSLIFLGFLVFGKQWIGSLRPTIVFRNQSSNVAQDMEATAAFELKSPETEIFNAIELNLIRYMLEKNRQHFTVSIDEINKILGLSEKNESVQKKNRSEMINTINRKWAIAQKSDLPLLIRQRAELDKRSFEYFIHTKWVNKMNALLVEGKS